DGTHGCAHSRRPLCLSRWRRPPPQYRGARSFRPRHSGVSSRRPGARLTGVSMPTDAVAPIFSPEAFGLNPAVADLIARARAFGARVLAPRAARHDRDATFPIENFHDMRGEGLLAICIPREHGGLGADFTTYCLAAAELGRFCGATALSWNMHVCSTLWSGALADDLDMAPAERAQHRARREAHYRRILDA